MKRGKPSQTASMVALFRALADAGLTSATGFHDPTAQHLLPVPWAQLFRWLRPKAQQRPLPQGLVGLRAGCDLLALRTLIIDAHLHEALEQGARQVVILGAGLDGRAYRVRELAETRVFEVDHPATQAWKRRRAATLPVVAKSLTYLPVNFEQDSLDAALAAAGHDPQAPTAWLWEGVVMYLTHEAVRATLRTIGSRSAPGSAVIIQYNTRSPRWPGISLLLRFWKEPQIGIRTPDELAADLRDVGFEPWSDTTPEDWARSFEAAPPGGFQQGPRVIAART